VNVQRIVRWITGLAHRVTYATLFAVMTWFACGYPAAFGRHVALQNAVCYGLDYPIAVVGRLMAPYRGIDVFFDRGGEWCDFCSAQGVLWAHVRFAVPIYVVLFYIPTFVLWIARRFRKRTAKKDATSARAVDQT